MPRIFDLFSRLDRSLKKAPGGLGAGLSLVKRMVKLHGGSALASSAGEDKGSEFVLRLTMASEAILPPDQSVVGAAPVHARKHRVLVADDNHDCAEGLAMVLRLKGHDVRTATNGEQAVDIAETFRPHVVLLDIGMPKLNGYEACRRIRARAWGTSVLLVAFTGWGQDEDRRKSQEAGFDHHLVKPVDDVPIDRIIATTPQLGIRD